MDPALIKEYETVRQACRPAECNPIKNLCWVRDPYAALASHAMQCLGCGGHIRSRSPTIVTRYKKLADPQILRRQAIIALWRSKRTYRAIALELGCTLHVVGHVIRRHLAAERKWEEKLKNVPNDAPADKSVARRSPQVPPYTRQSAPP